MTDPEPGLRGRRSECAALDQLLEGVRAGQSRVLVVRGEAGVGKTVLLDYLTDRASGCRIARAAGVESEVELAFAGLHQLCAPFLDRLDHLPEPQRDALGTAFGLTAGKPPDRFVVGLAVLGLLAEAGEEAPLVCVLDDAQWLDLVSAQTLAFVAHRLLAERVALVFGVREPTADHGLAGLPQLELGGLSDVDARALLDSVIRGPVDEAVRDRIVAETRGNPLALLELPRGLSPAALAGGFGLPETMPMAGRIEEGFLRRLRALPDATRRLLLAAASEPVGDLALLWRAAERLGIEPGAAGPAEAAGLIELGGDVRFRHPLVRSAACRAASPAELEAAHRALAEMTDPEVDPDRRAWHLAQAAVGPDEAVAGELERSAGRAQARGGVAAAAAFLERATELTGDPALRGARALDAAQAKFDAGATDAALALLAAAELSPLDALQSARLVRLRARITFTRRRGSNAPRLLLDAAQRLEPLDAALARETFLEAIGAGIFAGRSGGRQDLREIAEAVRASTEDAEPQGALEILLHGMAIRYTDGYAAAVPTLKRAMDALARDPDRNDADLRMLWLASPVAHEVWDDEAWHEMAARALRLARRAGALAVLPIALTYRAGFQLHAGELAASAAMVEEADAISRAIGVPPLAIASLALLAWRGDEARALALIEPTRRDAAARGEGRAIALAEYSTSVLYNGLGRYDAAFEAAQRTCEYEDLGTFSWALVELIEAGARCGRRDAAEVALAQLEQRTRAGGTDWAAGFEARSRALLAGGDAADALYREALERLSRSRITVHVARAHLIYGEWLRREGRRRDAREQLRAAHEMFGGMGAEGFAERARRDLLATGETARKRTTETLDDLTAQEAQIAQLAAGGDTNPEIGAELFISPRTVEWHLRRVFAKLGISSRKELGGALRDSGRSALPA